MNNSIFYYPYPENEPVLDYKPGTKERKALIAEMERMKSEVLDIPLIIGGKEVADKLAEELVFNRRLKASLDNLKSTNYLATGEFSGAVKQGLNYLLQNNLISKRGHKKILDLLEDLGF